MLLRMIDACALLAQVTPAPEPSLIPTLPNHAELVGWTGTILSIATAFTGGFVMIYQRVQRARRDDMMEWMKLRQGSLQALLEQAKKERAETRAEVEALKSKFDAATKRNSDQHEQIIELTHHLTQLGILIGQLPRRLGLVPLPILPLMPDPSDDSAEAIDRTIACLEGFVEQMRDANRGQGGSRDAPTPAEAPPVRTPETTTDLHESSTPAEAPPKGYSPGPTSSEFSPDPGQPGSS